MSDYKPGENLAKDVLAVFAERDRLRALLERAEEALDLAVDRVEGEMAVGRLPPGNSIHPRYASVLADIRKELGK